jgi:hypothetical protein
MVNNIISNDLKSYKTLISNALTNLLILLELSFNKFYNKLIIHL